MKLGYFADGRWSHLALERIVSDKQFDLCFIVPRFDTQDPVLRQWADKLKIDFLPLSNVNSPASLELLKRYHADLFVSMSFDQILKKDFLTLPPGGVINCHAGALPFYRGRNILNWALINDAAEFGVTIHAVNEGIDTGDIILQRKEPISDADTYKTLLDRATVLCADTLYEALVQMAEGVANRVPQSTIHSTGFYSGRRVEGDEWIDWSWPSRRIFNFVRGITSPGPCARTIMEAEQVLVEHVSLIPGAPDYIGTPGEIVGVNEFGVTVKTGDSTILLSKFTMEKPVSLLMGRRFRSTRDALIDQLKQRVEVLEGEVRCLRDKAKSEKT